MRAFLRWLVRLWGRSGGGPALTFDDLLAPVAPESYLGEVLEAWRWLVPQGVKPVAVTAFGDMFLLAQDGAVLFLDTAAGKCVAVAASLEEWKTKTEDPELRDEWFMPGLLNQLRESGVRLSEGESYSPVHSICLGGSFTVDNWRPIPWRVHIVSEGSLHEAVKDLPPGTKITGIKFTPL